MRFTEFIRAKVTSQEMHAPTRNNSGKYLMEVLDRAWWVQGKHGILARVSTSIRAPLKILEKSGATKILLDNTFRMLTVPNYLHFTLHQDTEIMDEEIRDILEKEEKISRLELSRLLNIEPRKLDYRIKRELKKFSLINYDNIIWRTDTFSQGMNYKLGGKSPDRLDINEIYTEVIRMVLLRYPYLSVEQLSYLTGIHEYDLARPLTTLTRVGDILRGITRDESPDEYFVCKEYSKQEIDWEEVPVFILEKRDALVEIIKLERYFNTRDGNFWIFIKGLPQAEFNLDKVKGKREYQVTHFALLKTCTERRDQIFKLLFEWAIEQNVKIDINIQDGYAITAKKLVQTLLSRGYVLNNDVLTLTRVANQQEEGKKTQPRKLGYTWQDVGIWYRKKQFLSEHNQNADHVIATLVQLDSINSLAYRMRKSPGSISMDQSIYWFAINFNLGFTSIELIQDILFAYPKLHDLKYQDRTIINYLPGTTREISERSGQILSDVRKRLFFLERARIIRRDITNTETCTWMEFSDGLGFIVNRGDGKRSNSAISDLILKYLAVHIPLTLLQLSQVLGFSVKELTPIKNDLLRSGKIVEGYYLDFEQDTQLTIPELLEEMQHHEEEGEDNEFEDSIDILPFSDPIAVLHTRSLLLRHSELQPRERYHPDSEWWLILWNAEPIGYIIRQPSSRQAIDYNIQIKLRGGMDTLPIISGVIQEIVHIFRQWFDDEMYIETINGTSLSHVKYESLGFMLATLGLNQQ